MTEGEPLQQHAMARSLSDGGFGVAAVCAVCLVSYPSFRGLVCVSFAPPRPQNGCLSPPRRRSVPRMRGDGAVAAGRGFRTVGGRVCEARSGGRARVRVGLRSRSGGSVRPPPHGFRTCSRRLRGAALRGAVFSVRCGAQPLLRAGRSLRSLPVRPMPPDDCLQRISAKCGRPT